MPPLPETPGADLSGHSDFITEIGDLISGQRALRESDRTIRVYKIPDRELMRAVPDTRKTEYGYIEWDESGFYEKHSGRDIIPAGDATQKLDFLASVRDVVEQRRRKLATEANKRHERSSAKPGGQEGHMLDLYSDLLGQIEHEHYRQRRKVDGG